MLTVAQRGAVVRLRPDTCARVRGSRIRELHVEGKHIRDQRVGNNHSHI
ncbi:MAG: hypothetical protein GX146_02610 [Myxococcales bacterium]|nr:hypothetical protein [Myxococcales bacterium]